MDTRTPEISASAEPDDHDSEPDDNQLDDEHIPEDEDYSVDWQERAAKRHRL